MRLIPNDVCSLVFDASASTLTCHSSVEVGFHPSWIEFYTSDHSLVFAGLEQKEGKIVAIKYNDSGHGSVVGETPSGGADPCSLTATKDELFVANYSSGTVAVLPIASHPPYFLQKPVITQLHGSGPNTERQQSSHAHQVLLNDQYGELLVADLGADRVYRFSQQGGVWVTQGQIQYDPGSGPRHVALHDGALYTLLELSSLLSKHRFPPLPSAPPLIAVKPTMSNPPVAPHDIGRYHRHFSIAGDALELVAEVRTGLKHLRGMVFGGADDKWLVTGGVLGGGVKVFERIDGGKGLKVIAENDSIEAPTGFYGSRICLSNV
ncbi:Lactonase, 7-bladed beta-propeller-domain-containing protein [Mycena sp. CBHHK59/15]|nr:Lactonase, 7-bladed beta-propeller-domain-containing protein [Mycena sp. CBHHK59/15]